jgi:hypothetical protein
MSSRTDDGFEAKFQAALVALSAEERAQIEAGAVPAPNTSVPNPDAPPVDAKTYDIDPQ